MAQSKLKPYAASEFGFSEKEMKEMVSGLTPVEDEGLLSDAFFLKVSSEQWDSVAGIRDAVAYLGFDPRKIIAEFLAKAKGNPANSEDTPKIYSSPTGKSYQLYDKNHAATDLLFFITLFLERGNNKYRRLRK